MVAVSARVATAVMVVAAGGPGRRTARPAAVLGWGHTQGPPRVSLRHQRVPEADTWGALATEGTIFWGWLAWSACGGLGGAAEPQLRHGMAVRGPSQKAGGFLRACGWKERCGESLYLPLSQGRPVEGPFPFPHCDWESGAGVREGQQSGESGK